MSTPEGRVFSSWKEIATFLGKGVRTVQRWEKTLGLPVRRPNGTASNVVVATERELRRWMGEGEERSLSRLNDNLELRKISDKLLLLEARYQHYEQALIKLESRFLRLERALGFESRVETEPKIHRRRITDDRFVPAPEDEQGSSSSNPA